MNRAIIWIECIALLAAADRAGAQGPTYSLGPAQDLLDASFYAGQPEDGSDVAGRTLINPTVSPDGSQVAFLALNLASFQTSVFVVDVGTSTSWRRITPDDGFIDFFPAYTPDGSRIYFNDRLYDVATATVALDEVTIFGEGLRDDVGATRMPSGNWLVMRFDTEPDKDQYIMLPIQPNGEEDPTRAGQGAVIADFTDMIGDPNNPQLNADGTALAFFDYNDLAPPGPDQSDVYVLTDLQTIVAAPKVTVGDPRISELAPTTLTHPRVKTIRASESPNVATNASLTQDNSLVIFAEDQNNVFEDTDFFNTAAAGDWDVFISKADGTGSDFHIAVPGSNQVVGGIFPGGIRITYFALPDLEPNPLHLHLYATSIETANPVPGTDLGNNDIQTTDTLVANDGSGSAVVIAPNTVVNFPDGEPQEIQIETPINPVTEAQLPPDAPVDAIPVVRDFGPDGTTFAPPIAITISYSDAEIAGLIEASLSPYLFNDSTGVFDIPVLEEDIIERNLIENYITFEVDHFSVYGLGAQEIELRVGPWRDYR